MDRTGQRSASPADRLKTRPGIIEIPSSEAAEAPEPPIAPCVASRAEFLLTPRGNPSAMSSLAVPHTPHNDRSAPSPFRLAHRRVRSRCARLGRVLAITGLGLGVVMSGACSGGEVGTLAVVGEKTGVLIWHPVERAESYDVTIIVPTDSVVHSLTTADTVAPMPPSFMPVKGTQWTVRAKRGARVLAESGRQPIY
jgi:hypothetical protein